MKQNISPAGAIAIVVIAAALLVGGGIIWSKKMSGGSEPSADLAAKQLEVQKGLIKTATHQAPGGAAMDTGEAGAREQHPSGH